ncbi:MAG: HNH endonuclease [Pyrinomonadaceae bacterium]
MSQIDGWFYPEDREPYTIVGCPRSDCEARATANSYEGPCELMPECVYLIDERYIPPAAKRVKQSDQLPRAKKADIWAKTGGRCYYCGLVLEYKLSFCVDHIIPQIGGGGDNIENVVPACRNCNSSKGTKSLEQFRFHRRMQKFQQQNGVRFTFPQVEYLKRIGVKLDIPEHVFWFEQ